jgi:hypothetical protein
MESALKIMLFMWSVSFSVLGGQYIIGDVINVDLQNTWTDFNGDGVIDTSDHVKLKSHLLTIIDEDTINETTQNIVTANFTTNSTYYDKVETFTTGAAFVAWELVTLLSGTYIFNLLYLMGLPVMFIAFFVILYLALLARAIIGYVRGI